MSTLITFLGTGQQAIGGYRKANYQFPDGSCRETRYFGLALAEFSGVQTTRILGTSGSMWDALTLEKGDTNGNEALWEQLAKAVSQNTVTQTLLDAVASMLNQSTTQRFELRLIPYGFTEEEQVDILRALTEGLEPGGSIILDVTHGLRHLPMLGLLSIFYLRAATNNNIDAIYYGAFEQTRDNITPALRLDGLLKIYDWIRALESFNKDGDYGIFKDLFIKENLPGEQLAEAAFLERIANASLSSQKLTSTLQKIDLAKDTSPAAKLFLPLLINRTEWRNGGSRAERERRLAIDYLKRHDYLRAAQFGYEALVSENSWGDPNDFDAREASDRQLYDDGKSKSWEMPGNFSTLKNLRNALAHGVMDTNRNDKRSQFIKKLTSNETALQHWLTKTLETR
ncbi:MAG: TIGR02221 family CRISPR-associated protein [Azonexus sp.]|nr:TIGR02221 family CRISPR-associated protein [Azonexus sp.]MDZ4313237.1 TIGR02221 family CRISPR-associated protein [Azonexus sp.]